MEKIAKIIADIEGWFSELNSIGIRKPDELKDIKNFHAVSMLLFSILNGVITIGEEIVAIKKLGFPTSYRNVFEILNKNKIISKELYEKISELIGYRNMFAHEYWAFTQKDVWEAQQRIGGAKLFLEQVKKYLAKTGLEFEKG